MVQKRCGSFKRWKYYWRDICYTDHLKYFSGGCWNIWGTTLTQNGTFTTTLATLGFRNTANLNVPAIIAASVVMNGTGGITLNGNMRVDSALTLTNGNITLGANNLTMKGG